MTQATFYWHDYETWGVNPMLDRPAQFAGLRTDLELNPVGRPLTIYAQPTPDFLPHPEAIMITGITPQHALNQGMNEASFAEKIATQFNQPDTTIIGYNNIRFDDEVTRFLFYRNFIDPYAHTWRDNNARWDLIDLVRACYALRPEGIKWPYHPDGRVSMKLEDLTRANGIEHGQAHDAMADVYATIAIAKLIKQVQPKLFDYAYKMRRKAAVQQQLDLVSRAPFVHVSGLYGAKHGYLSVLMPLAYQADQPNNLICWDLRHNPRAIQELSTEALRERFYTPKQEREERQLATVGNQVIGINKCPFVAPLKVLDEARAKHWQLDLEHCEQHRQWLLEHPEVIDRLLAVFEGREYSDQQDDVDNALYSGGFFSDQDRTHFDIIRRTPYEQLAALDLNFDDPRIAEMLFRYRARNYPNQLNEQELKRWQHWCKERLQLGTRGSLTLDEFILALERCAEQHQQSPQKMALLKDLYQYVEQL